MGGEPSKDKVIGIKEGRKSATADYKEFMVSEIETRIKIKAAEVHKLYAEMNELESIKKYAETIKS